MCTSCSVFMTILTAPAVSARMKCSAQMAARIEDIFTTVTSLVNQVREHKEDLTEIQGVGEKTASVLKQWWENRFEIEDEVQAGSVTREGNSFIIHNLGDWSTEIQ